MYTAPEVRELGTVSAFTLGSLTPRPGTMKAPNNAVDLLDTAGYATLVGYGSPCNTVGIGGNVNCSTP